MESDKTVSFETFVASGLQCRIVESPVQREAREHRIKPISGPNGYVGVPPEHSLYKADYNDAVCGHSGCYEHRLDSKLDVHGGITYSGRGWWDDALWYFGFDTGHCGDDEKVWTMEYLRTQCEQLAKQLAEWETSK